MPIIQSAIKKMHQDVRRTRENRRTLVTVKDAVREFKLHETTKNLEEAYSALDSAVKKQVIHKNKAARLKSRLAKKVKQSRPKADQSLVEKVKK